MLDPDIKRLLTIAVGSVTGVDVRFTRGVYAMELSYLDCKECHTPLYLEEQREGVCVRCIALLLARWTEFMFLGKLARLPRPIVVRVIWSEADQPLVRARTEV